MILSRSSTSNFTTLPLKTVPSLKSPFEGVKIAPFPKPDEAVATALEQLGHADWEKNVDGVTALLRLVVHHPELVLVEYSQVTQLILKQIKNLRSQVSRNAVHVVAEMYSQLKRNMESDMEKIVIPLLLKTGDTNKFLREDCHAALDSMVENVSPAKAILVITAETLNHKNPVIRTTVSRLLAYIVDRMGPAKVMSGAKDITDKILPAVSKLAQDGSLDARIYAKMTFRTLMEHPDFDRILKKNVTQNTLRNLEKILDSIRNAGSVSAASSRRSVVTRSSVM